MARIAQLSMNIHQTPEPSMIQDSTLRPGHDVAPTNLASQTRDNVDASSQVADNRTYLAFWQVNPHIDHPHSRFPGQPLRL
jgi:hypothetical protein